MNMIRSIALGSAISLMSVTGAFAQEVTLRFQHFISPKGAVPALFMTPWAEKIEAKPQVSLSSADAAIFMRQGVL